MSFGFSLNAVKNPFTITLLQKQNEVQPMTSRQQLIIEIIRSAITSFNEKETYLIESDLSERCICAKFAFYLKKAIQDSEFRDFEVDVEYNRGYDGVDRSPKRIDDRPITVDLIVHKRGNREFGGFQNLICIEMKKSTDRRGTQKDEQRLQKMVDWEHGYLYEIGFMIVINMKRHALELKEPFVR